MTDEANTLEYFKQRLLDLQRELQQTEAEDRGSTDRIELDQAKVGRLSRMDALQVQAMSAESSRRRTIQLQRIEGALQRLEQGEYGACLQCGNEISVRRLEFDPTTFLCVTCAKLKG